MAEETRELYEMDPEVIHVPATMDQEQVAALAARYDLMGTAGGG